MAEEIVKPAVKMPRQFHAIRFPLTANARPRVAIFPQPGKIGVLPRRIDAANLLYTIGDFERDPQRRAESIAAMQKVQDHETGLFHESTHHPIHTTAHVLAALELYDAGPLYPVYALEEYREIEKMRAFLEGLDWEGEPWGQSHRGAGLYAALRLTGRVDAAW